MTFCKNRRSSVYAGARTKALKDPRPVTSKAFQQESIHRLIKFLSENGYEYAISPKLLTRPTGKDFLNIVRFLIQQIDPSFQFTGKHEDDIPAVFKALKYAFKPLLAEASLMIFQISIQHQ